MVGCDCSLMTDSKPRVPRLHVFAAAVTRKSKTKFIDFTAINAVPRSVIYELVAEAHAPSKLLRSQVVVRLAPHFNRILL